MQIRFRLLSLLTFAALSAFGIGTASAQNLELHATLVGGNETPNAGHPTGYGAASVIFRGATLVCVTIEVTGIPTPTAAHIHKGYGPTAGLPVVTLATPTGSPVAFSASCVAISAADSAAIRKNPEGFYINVHTAAPYTTGALRGQLF
jgi:hypothetical protein